MPADDCLWAENCNRAEDGREPTIEPNEQRSVLLSCGRFDTCRRSTLSCWRRIRISATSFVLGLKSEAMTWRISRSNSTIKWQGYRVSPSRLAESNFRYTQVVCGVVEVEDVPEMRIVVREANEFLVVLHEPKRLGPRADLLRDPVDLVVEHIAQTLGENQGKDKLLELRCILRPPDGAGGIPN